MKDKILLFLLLFTSISFAQINMDGLKNLAKDKAKQKAHDAAVAARAKMNDAIDKKLEKERAEFDASNFNYAISFTDNSGLFETEEKGSKVSNTLISSKDFLKGKELTDYQKAYGYNRKGEILFAGNKFGSARSMFFLSESFFKTSDSLVSLAYSQLQNNKALLYQATGRYTKSLECIDVAIALREKMAPASELLTASYNNKAVLLKDMGKYAEAEKMIDAAIAMSKTTSGEKSLGYALTLNNKAMLLHATGRLEKAEELMNQSIAIAKETLGEKSSNYLKLTINLATIYRDMKKYDDAEKVYLNAIEIKQKKLGTNHPDYGHLKRGIAGLYWEMGKMDLVEKNLTTALQIYQTKFGDKNPATTATKSDLATYYRMNGNKTKALDYMTQVIAADKEIYGENHPEYNKQLENLAIAQWINGKNQEAATNYKIVLEKTSEYIDDYFAVLSETDKTKFWDKTLPRFNRFNSFAISNAANDNTLLESMINNQLHNKALLLNSSSKIRNKIMNSGDEALITDYNNWLATKEELARAYTMTKEQLKEENINVDSLENKTNSLEKNLAEKSAEFGKGNNKQKTTYQQIASSLKADEAAVEIIQIQKFDNSFTKDIQYAAIVITNPAKLELVLFADGNKMEKEGITYYREQVKNLKADNQSYGLFWEPIEAKITGKKKIYVSLDGIYNQISLLTFKDPKTNKYLIEKENIIVVGNTKDILTLKAGNTGARAKTAFLLGYPNYGGNDIIASLPGTKTEVENITKVLKASSYTTHVVMKDEATEEAVKAAHAEVIHIATHGFFLSDLSEVESDKVLGVETSKARKNPLLRSGLMLANCESVFDETGEKANANNGILTAYEAMNLSLDKTDLVVMSACETGLGDIKSGEGVYGLQRSFLVAGAKSVIMSLWEVSDDATMELMSAFYKNYAVSGNKQEAFLAAQKQIKIKYKEPFFWGAFVLIGN
ncbi:MAG: CHAT domain-containing protein [Bacteroidetes bacterium]|nr:CHAT domain-containing protein [Bacteroidota bacterium]